jgi:putative tryptophan/tyrosine transport system substrate-binding protein
MKDSAMRRREFIALFGGVAAAWPVAARAQQRPTPVIGYFATNARVPGSGQNRLNAFKRRLADHGWIEGRNFRFEEKYGNNDPARLPAAAAELVALQPSVIFVANSPSLISVRRATGLIPIVFANVIDPVGQGFVSSLAQPGGNITGFAESEFAFVTKNLELLKKISPTLTRVAFLYDPTHPMGTSALSEVASAAAATALGFEASKTPVRTRDEIQRVIEDSARTPNSGLYVFATPLTGLHGALIIALAAQHRLPAVYQLRSYVADGGLASYSSDDLDHCRRAAGYVDRILKGEKPANLPVQLPTKFELSLNLKTAKAMGLTLSPEVLALADEVIE